jgi:hypothetical protein
MRRIVLTVFLVALAFVSPVRAADDRVSVDALGWMAGTWQGELFGSHAEERWSVPAGHHMLGVFRLWTDEGPGVYELLEISESESDAGEPQVYLRFKHFNVGTLEPWEKDEPLEFLLSEYDTERALFLATSEEQRVVTSMEYRRQDDGMRVHVKGEHDNGEAFEFVAEFTLQQD